MIVYPLTRTITGANPTRRVTWTETFEPMEDRGFSPIRWEEANVRLRTEAEAKHWVAIFDYGDQPARL
jgi:hypothetical protein